MVAGAPPPSGRQFEIRLGGQRAVVVEVGGAIREYSVDGFPVLDGFPVDAMSDGGRGVPLVPWPNRIRDGVYEFAGRRHQLALTEPGRRNAIHGLARWRAWEAVAVEPARVRMELLLHPEPGYPFALRCAADYRLTEGGLEVTLEGTNAGASDLPYAAGHHPYVRASGEPHIDSATLRLPARTRLPTGRRGLPTGARRSLTAFRRPRRIGSTRLDAALADLERDGDGLARTVLAGPERTVTVWVDPGFPYLMVFTGDGLQPAARRRGLAVEPMTAPPDAFNSGEGLIVLRPGARHSACWGIVVE